MNTFAASGLMLTVMGLTTVLFLYGRARSRISCMAAMMIAMSAAMVAGLVSGLSAMIFGFTLLSAAVGAVVVGAGLGLAVGASVSTMAALDGLLAGLMGGLMGPMTAAMFDRDALTLMLGVVGWVSVIAAILMGWIIKGELGSLPAPPAAVLWWGLALAGVVGFSAGVGGPHVPPSPTPGQHLAVPQALKVRVRSGTYQPGTPISVRVGLPVRLLLLNEDQVPHEFGISGLPVTRVRNTRRHPLMRENETIHAHASAKGNDEVLFTPVASGDFEVLCSLPGHSERAILRVIAMSD